MSPVDFVAHLSPIGHSSRAVQSLVQMTSYFNYSGTLAIPFASGTYSLRVSQPVPSGLFATYYNGETLLTTHVSSRIDSSVDFSLAANAKPAVSLTTGSSYSVRWSGFVRPQYVQVYTFFAGVQTAVERMKLWVDNSLLVGQWTSISATENSGTLMIGTANGYYDVVMEYKQPSGTGVVQGAKLSWQASLMSKTPIPRDKLYQSRGTLASPYTVSARTGAMCASTSSISNLVLNQIGPLSATFTITARDEYQNLLDGSSIAVPILAKSVASMSSSSYFDFSKSSLPVVSGSSSEFLLPVSLTISGEYKPVASSK